MTARKENKPRLFIRNALMRDIPDIMALLAHVYKDMPSYSEDMLRGQIGHFAERQAFRSVLGAVA